MKKIFAVFMVGCVLFSLSAGVSWYLQQKQEKTGEAEPASHAGSLKPGINVTPFAGARADAAPSKSTLRPSSRAAPAADPETIAQMASSLRSQLDAVKGREQQLSVRQKNLDLIHQDMRKERDAILDLQKQVSAEMKALVERMATLEGKAVEVTQQRDKLSEQVKQAKKSITEVDTVEQTRIKQMAAIYDTMEPESAAQILMQMVDSGKRDMAVKILAAMRERQSARVLALLPDRAVAVDLLDKLKGLKRPSATAAGSSSS